MIHLINLEKARSRKGWTQEQLSEKLGVARSTYANYENGKREPDLKMINKISEILEVSFDYLLGKDEGVSSGRAHFGGGKDWTPEEHAAADAFIEAWRKRKDEEKKRGDR